MKRWNILLCAACLAGVWSMPVQADYETRVMSTALGMDAEGNSTKLEAAIMINGGICITEARMVQDNIVSVLIVTDVLNGITYEAELEDVFPEYGLATFDTISDDAKNDAKNFRKAGVSPGETVDCYLLDTEIEEQVISVRISDSDYKECELGYLVDYDVLDDEAFEQLEGAVAPGALIDAEGDCVGILLPEEVDGYHMLVFGLEEEETEAVAAVEDEVEVERWESDGRLYIGQKKDGVLHGWGICIYEDNDIYVGEWVDGLFEGRGNYYWPGGDYYSGLYEDDERNGKGAYYWADGSYYSGFYADGERHGEGIYVDEYGDSARYTYEYGELID